MREKRESKLKRIMGEKSFNRLKYIQPEEFEKRLQELGSKNDNN